MKEEPLNPSKFPLALDPIPEYLTHYFERSAGPFLNICDLDDNEIQKIREMELSSDIKWTLQNGLASILRVSSTLAQRSNEEYLLANARDNVRVLA